MSAERFADGHMPTLPATLRQLAARVRRLALWRGTLETFCIEQDDIALALWRIARALETGDPAITAGSGAAGAPRSFPGEERSYTGFTKY